MRLLCVIVLFFSVSARAQVSATRIPDKELFAIGKIWGLLKYYHPVTSQGKIDWDAELLKVLEGPASTKAARVADQWIQLLDKLPFDTISPVIFTCDSLTKRNYDLSWIDKQGLSPATRSRFRKLVDQPANIGFYYTRSEKEPIRFNSTKEKAFTDWKLEYAWIDLFRTWNAVEYFYPYKYLLDKKWDNVLKEMIPVFRSIRSMADYRKTIMLLTANIQDTHTSLESTYQYDVFGKLTSPFSFQVVDGSVVITVIKDAEKVKAAGLSLGDRITHINNEPVNSIIQRYSKFVPASNKSVLNREAYNFLFSSNDSVCLIKGQHIDGSSFSGVKLTRIARIFLQEWDQDGIPNYHLRYKGKDHEYLVWNQQLSKLDPAFFLDDKAYFEFASLTVKDIDSLLPVAMTKKGMVIDLRGYSNNGALLRIFDYLFTSPQHFGIKTHADFNRPGMYCFEDHIITPELKLTGKNNPDAYKGKVVVLINEYTQSAAEMWGMIFKRIPGVVFVGSQTAGADGNKTSIRLTNGNRIVLSGLGIYYPDGGETQRIGIKPDVVVRPTISSIRKKEDLLLLKAFEIIDQQK